MNKLESIEWEMATTEAEIIAIEQKVKSLNCQLEQLKKEREKLDWKFSKDEQRFGGLSIESNYPTWKHTKAIGSVDDVFFVETLEDHNYSMSIQDAKELIQYLQQKIDYLEGE